MKKQKLYFITDATKNFDTAARHLMKLAKNSDFFENCIYFKPTDLPKDFKQNIKIFFNINVEQILDLETQDYFGHFKKNRYEI